MKCIDMKSNTFRVPLIIWIVAVLILVIAHPIKAETGSISVSKYSQIYYLLPSNAEGGSFNGSHVFGFANSSYSKLYQWGYNTLDANRLTSSTNSNTTSFNIVEGGTGSGFAEYHKNASTGLININWICSNYCTINSKRFILTYTNEGFATDLFSPAGGISVENTVAFGDVTRPVFVLGVTWQTQGYGVAGDYYADVAYQATDIYNLTYPVAGWFQLNLLKDNIQTKANIHDASGLIYYQDNQFNTTNFTVSNQTKQGIYLNLTTADGAYNDVTLNSTGFTPAPTPTPAPGGQFNPSLPIPSSGGSIQFNQTKYVVGNTVRVEWAISNTDWNGIGQTFIISFYQNNIAFLTDAFPTGQIPISSQTGNYSFIVNQPSVIRADLDGGFLFATNVLGSAYTTIVPATPAFISVPATAQQGQNVTINYGFAAGSTVNIGFIKDVVLDDFGQPILTTLTYTNLSCPCGTSGTISKIFGSIGKHRLTLFDATALKTVATADIQISASGVAPGLNITSNSLTLDNVAYNYNDVIIGSYQISTANYSLYPYFRISLISNSGIFGNSIDVPSSQTGTFQLPVNSGMFQTLQSGAAFVNLTAQSSAFNNTLVLMAYVPVTINANFNGYSVSANPQTICKNQPVYVKYTGQTGTGTLKTSWVTPAGTTKTNSFNFSANGTKVFSFVDGTIMDKSAVQFDIYDLIGNFQVGSIVKYQSTGCTQAGVTAAPTGTPGQVQSGGSAWNSANINLLSLIAMPAFYGLLILIGSIIACSKNEKAASNTGIVAFIVANVEAVIGLWAPFTLYILVVTWVLLGIYFTVGRKTTTQN